MRKPPDVLIIMEGGCIQNVYTRDGDLRVVKIEWDDEFSDNDGSLTTAMGTRGMVCDFPTEALEEISVAVDDLLGQHDAE